MRADMRRVLDVLNEHHETWFAGERLEPRLAAVVSAVWIRHGIRLGLNFGDCVAIARTAMERAARGLDAPLADTSLSDGCSSDLTTPIGPDS